MAGIGADAEGTGINLTEVEEGNDLFEPIAAGDRQVQGAEGGADVQNHPIETDRLKQLEAYDKEAKELGSIYAQEIVELQNQMVQQLFNKMVEAGIENVPSLKDPSYSLYQHLANSLNALVTPADVLVKGMDPVTLLKPIADTLESLKLELVISEKHKVDEQWKYLKHTFDLACNRAQIIRSMMEINSKVFDLVQDDKEKNALLAHQNSLEQDWGYLLKFIEETKPLLGMDYPNMPGTSQ